MSDIGLYSLDEDNYVVFSFKNMEKVVTGASEALQIVANHLLTTPGTNTYNRDEGGGLQSLARGFLRSKDEVAADAAIVINRAQSSILKSQSSDKAADATITGLRLLDVVVNKENLEISIRILITLLDGNSFQANFRVT